jgi:hypothetical protein
MAISPTASWEVRQEVRRQARQKLAWNRVPVTRQRPIADGVNIISSVSGFNTANERLLCRAPDNADITDLIVEFAGFYTTVTGQVNVPIGYTVTAALEYPLATTPVSFRFNGATSQAVTAGRTSLFASDPLPVAIPRGAQFAIKQFRSWTGGSVDFPLASGAQAGAAGEWLNYGLGLTDQTTTLTVQTATLGNPPFLVGSGLGIGIYGRVSAPVPVLAIMGDSITQGLGGGEIVDPTFGGTGFERGLRSVIPVINVARFGDNASQFLAVPDGRHLVLRERATHALIHYGRNDLDLGAAAATMVARTRNIANPFLARGVQVYAGTITPKTTSSDGYITAVNQTIFNVPIDSERLAYNALLRANWQSYGFAGILDFARAVDPTDSSKWNADGTTGRNAVGVATLTATAISSVARPTYSAGTAYGGTGYPLSQPSLACRVFRYPDDPIRGPDAVITAATDGSGVVTGFTVVSGGAYSIPPMIMPQGIWTVDGTHMTHLSYSAAIAGTGLSPALFRV